MRKSNFQMSNPVLKKVVLEINNEFLPSEDSMNLRISDAKNITHNDENSATVSYAIRVFDEKFEFGAPFFIEVAYSAEFRWSKLELDEVDSLLNQNAPAILLGYIRPLVAQLTVSAGFPPLHIPLLNLQDVEEQE